MDTVHINLGNDSYDVIIDSGIIGRLGKETAPLSGSRARSHYHGRRHWRTVWPGFETPAGKREPERTADRSFFERKEPKPFCREPCMRGAGRLRVLCRRSAYRPWRTCCRRCDRLCCSNLPERDSLRAGAHFSPGTDRQRHRRENLHRYQWKKKSHRYILPAQSRVCRSCHGPHAAYPFLP